MARDHDNHNRQRRYDQLADQIRACRLCPGMNKLPAKPKRPQAVAISGPKPRDRLRGNRTPTSVRRIALCCKIMPTRSHYFESTVSS